jgi:hypothetical protein
MEFVKEIFINLMDGKLGESKFRSKRKIATLAGNESSIVHLAANHAVLFAVTV